MKALILAILLTGCVHFSTAHDRFIRSMDVYLEMWRAEGEAWADKGKDGEPNGFMDPDALCSIEELDAELMSYHYAQKMVWGLCHYHVVVEKRSRLPVRWGFDYDKSNPKKACGVAG